jgi:hypothetical protein
VDDAAVDWRRCARCDKVVGVYEPAWLLLPDGARHDGSPLTFADALDAPGAVVLHADCFEFLGRGDAESRAP